MFYKVLIIRVDSLFSYCLLDFSKEMLSTEGKVVILQHFRWLSSGSPIALSSVIHSAANLNMGLQGHKV